MSASARHRRLRRRQPAQRAEGVRAPRAAGARSPATPDRIASAPAVVLPGQGAFGTCMQNLARRGLVEPVRRGGALGPSVPRHLRRHAAPVRGERGVARRARARHLRRARGALPARPRAARSRTWAGTSSGSCGACRRSPRSRTATTSTSCTPTTRVPADPGVIATTTDYGVEFVSSVGPRQRLRRRLPPREEPARRPRRCSRGFVRTIAGRA